MRVDAAAAGASSPWRRGSAPADRAPADRLRPGAGGEHDLVGGESRRGCVTQARRGPGCRSLERRRARPPRRSARRRAPPRRRGRAPRAYGSQCASSGKNQPPTCAPTTAGSRSRTSSAAPALGADAVLRQQIDRAAAAASNDACGSRRPRAVRGARSRTARRRSASRPPPRDRRSRDRARGGPRAPRSNLDAPRGEEKAGEPAQKLRDRGAAGCRAGSRDRSSQPNDFESRFGLASGSACDGVSQPALPYEQPWPTRSRSRTTTRRAAAGELERAGDADDAAADDGDVGFTRGEAARRRRSVGGSTHRSGGSLPWPREHAGAASRSTHRGLAVSAPVNEVPRLRPRRVASRRRVREVREP